jgi:hypothetical protein
LIELDQRILDFMRGRRREGALEIRTSELPLRWASGGVLSIVRCGTQEWVPLFLRDIPPYGWNVSLGATERYFGEGGVEIEDEDYSWDYELCWPWKFIVREFLEETLVLRQQPQLGGRCVWQHFEFPPHVQIKVGQQQAQEFAENHLNLRRDQDGILIQAHQRGLPVVIRDDTSTNVEIVGSGAGGSPSGAWDVLVAINPLELGIEIIKVLEYTLTSSQCLLDGEVYKIGEHHQMVRMPMGLISLEYLYRNFGAPDYQLVFSEETVQPSVEGRAFGPDDIRVFRWDLDQRERVWGGQDANEWEKERFSEWLDGEHHLGRRLTEGLDGNTAAYPHLFTPATVKAMNLFFNCCERGRALASRYRSE